ncbi:MAG: methyltransferase domain-containing protein [Acidobacteria bacterium]|jgi:phosphatidylethanolamine/phosphatidyl-N-methylethanolamine N-methyltransferase|nr:methyltransferase domain-containing protein [Acidobacteriota bacterium]
MSLFDIDGHHVHQELLTHGDAAAPALSATPVEKAFMSDVYANIASSYDVFFGPPLHPGRVRAIERMDLQPGDRVLEVGVGTGISLPLYPRHAHITAIDFSASMLEKAHEKVAKHDLTHVRLCEMDASAIQFPDDSFDVVYAPYLINCVPDPITVAREMRRVCRSGGRIMFLNHFRSANPVMSTIERFFTPLTLYIGFKVDLDLEGLLHQTGLKAVSAEKVNFPKSLWLLVTCVK